MCFRINFVEYEADWECSVRFSCLLLWLGRNSNFILNKWLFTRMLVMHKKFKMWFFSNNVNVVSATTFQVQCCLCRFYFQVLDYRVEGFLLKLVILFSIQKHVQGKYKTPPSNTRPTIAHTSLFSIWFEEKAANKVDKSYLPTAYISQSYVKKFYTITGYVSLC
jgi:hypothetical protein